MISLKTVYVKKERLLSKWKIRRIAKKLEKQSKKEDIVVFLSKKQLENYELICEIESKGIKVLDGRWLFKFLLLDILEDISKTQGKPTEIMNVAIVVNNPDSIILSEITEIAQVVKSLKIVSKNISRFSHIEERLYLEFGIAIQVTNNKDKAISNSDVIIDIDEYYIEQYNICRDGVLVDISGVLEGIEESFAGKIINWYEVEYNEDILEELEDKDGFDKNIFYESLIYRKDTYQHIRKQLDFDKVKISKLYYNKEKY